MRSLLSVSILYFATTNLLNGKDKRFFFWVIIAALFHSLSIVASAIIYIAFRLFREKQISWHRTIGMLIVIPIVLYPILSILTYGNLLNFIEKIPILNKYQDYQSVLPLNQPVFSASSIIMYNVLMSVFMAVLLVHSIRIYFKTTKKNRGISVRSSRLLLLSSLGIVLGSISYVSRVSSFLAPLLIMAVYDLVPENNNTSLYLVPSILAYSIGFFIVFIFIANYTGFFPLHFIWEVDK